MYSRLIVERPEPRQLNKVSNDETRVRVSTTPFTYWSLLILPPVTCTSEPVMNEPSWEASST